MLALFMGELFPFHIMILKFEYSDLKFKTVCLCPLFTPEQQKEQWWESREKIEKCDYPRLGSVMRNPVKDVRRAGESVKEMKR